MFAFVIWDGRHRRLFAARDRLGIKPFYYRRTDREFIFASEIKSLLEFPAVKRDLNRGALPEYLAFGYVSGQDTLFNGIKSLPAGYRLAIDEDGNPTRPGDLDLPFLVGERCPA